MSPLTASILWALLLLIAWRWRPPQAATLSAWVLIIAFGALGACALWFDYFVHPEPQAFTFWKPTVVYWTLTAIMSIVPPLGGGYPAKIILGNYFALSNREWRWINRGFALLCAVLGGVNLVAASEASYKDWEGFKFSCMVLLLTIVLFRLNFVWLPILAEVSIHLYRRATAAYRYLSRLFSS
ncbi:MAG: septation protein IspZ [Steroidobacteraceae bacterium]|jgi:intracellular septation protein